MKQKDDDYQADDDGLFQQVALQGFDGIVDQPGAVVARQRFPRPAAARVRSPRSFLLDPVDDVQRVHGRSA